MNSIVEVAGDQHKHVCIPPGANGDYSVSYNLASMPVDDPFTVQDYVMKAVTTLLTNRFTEGPADFCSGGNNYSAVAGSDIDLFGYAYCGQGLDRQGCSDCLQGGAQVIRQSCVSSCYGAQASSEKCCIRFEGVGFCKVTKS
ncbi:hypothetical protein LINGRAHAP2_LOCUS12165 [Linum grandiflorum]